MSSADHVEPGERPRRPISQYPVNYPLQVRINGHIRFRKPIAHKTEEVELSSTTEVPAVASRGSREDDLDVPEKAVDVRHELVVGGRDSEKAELFASEATRFAIVNRRFRPQAG